MIQAKSLVQGKLIEGKVSQKTSSPVDGSEIAEIKLLSEEELTQVFLEAKKFNGSPIKNNFDELVLLADYFKKNHIKFTEQIISDAGFTQKDSEDLVNCSIEFCRDYSRHLAELPDSEVSTSFSFEGNSHPKIHFTSSPYGLISATTPRNTPLITELTIVVHALWSGNALVLRPSPGVAGTVAMMIEGLLKCFTKESLAQLNMVFSDAKEFVTASIEHANLLHYVGSSKYLQNTLISGIENGTKVLVDGDGCSMVVVDAKADIEKAAKACYEGLVRANGQICITIRAIIVAQEIHAEFTSLFLDLIKQTTVEPPVLKKEIGMGPVFSAAQAEAIIGVSKKYKVLSSGDNPLSYGPNYITPVVLELEPDNTTFLRESLFGPVVGIASYAGDEWKKWFEENPINLTDVVFSEDESFVEEFLTTSKSPRRVVNIDPTIESVFEPWGAFLPSGWNDVSYWFTKYRNYYQLIKV